MLTNCLTARDALSCYPKDHQFTKLVVLHAHKTLGHGSGTEHTLTQLRTKFWIPQGRRVVRNVVERCPECRRRFSTKTAGQMMAPLPKSRLTSMRAFEKVGVDYAGPFLTSKAVEELAPSAICVCLRVLPPGQSVSRCLTR